MTKTLHHPARPVPCPRQQDHAVACEVRHRQGRSNHKAHVHLLQRRRHDVRCGLPELRNNVKQVHWIHGKAPWHCHGAFLLYDAFKMDFSFIIMYNK